MCLLQWNTPLSQFLEDVCKTDHKDDSSSNNYNKEGKLVEYRVAGLIGRDYSNKRKKLYRLSDQGFTCLRYDGMFSFTCLRYDLIFCISFECLRFFSRGNYCLLKSINRAVEIHAGLTVSTLVLFSFSSSHSLLRSLPSSSHGFLPRILHDKALRHKMC